MKKYDEYENVINQIYKELELKASELIGALFHRMFDIRLAYFNGYYYKNKDGDYEIAYYPIPVISVKGYCDIEINLNQITVSTKLKQADALAFDYSKLKEYKFNSYGVEDYLDVFYSDELTTNDLLNKVKKSDETEIRYCFHFDFDIDKNNIFEFAKFLRRNNFYY